MALELLFLVRHSKAVESHPKGDRHRPLAPAGFERIEAVKARAAVYDCRADLSLSSPYLRAVQTRDAFLPLFTPTRNELSSSLTPDEDPLDALAELKAWGDQGVRRLVVFTHNPFVTGLAEALCTPGSVPSPEVDHLAFDTPTILALGFDRGFGRFLGKPLWIVHP